MIIKLIPVKSNTKVGGVIRYIAEDKGRIADYRNQAIFHNVRNTDLDAITQEFESNYSTHAKKRSNGNRAMHVILSVSPLDQQRMNLETMESIARKYIERTFPNALAFGAHHKEETHWHSHFIVSANELMSDKSTRLSKQELKDIHLEMVDYVKQAHPELEHTTIDTAHWGGHRHSEEEYYKLKRNPDITLTKDALKTQVLDIFRSSESSEDFYTKLKKNGLATYIHQDRTQGVYWIDESGKEKKMRFSRLELEPEQIDQLDKQHQRLKELEDIPLPVLATEPHVAVENAIKESDEGIEELLSVTIISTDDRSLPELASPSIHTFEDDIEINV